MRRVDIDDPTLNKIFDVWCEDFRRRSQLRIDIVRALRNSSVSGNINVLGNKTHLSNAAAVPATISREVLRHRHDFPLS